ncbi:MAG: rod shape-determining protein MreC [Deltaproteobacteria bacterium]|nr:rod shape-determining protein MreC [Deltaproteobacteria bacterium]
MEQRPPTWKLTAVLAVLVVLPVFLIVFSVKTEGETSVLSRAASALIGPFHRAITSGMDGISRAWRGYVWLAGAAQQNLAMHREIDEIRAGDAQRTELGLENRRLLDLLEYRKANAGHQMKLARVIAGGVSAQADMITVDRGTADGVQKGMAVVSVDGLVGRVFRAFRGHAEVLLVTDRNSAIAGTVQSSRARGIVKGRGLAKGATCDLEYIPRSETVNEGDLVVTTGLGDFFPKGVVIGKVVGVDRAANYLFQRAVVEPAVKFLSVEEVLVVVKTAAAEADR